MTVEINPSDEWTAAGKGALRELAKRVPGIAEALGAYEGFERKRKEKALAEFVGLVNDRLDKLEATTSKEWFATEEGQVFLGKAIDASVDAQTADKRQLFANALVNGSATDLTFATKLKFLDLLRSVSRLALDVLAELHQEFGQKAGKPESTVIMPERVAERLASGPHKIDPYAVVAAIEELRGAGLFSHVTSWRRNADGSVSSSSSYSAGNVAYTAFTSRFVAFISAPQSKT